jgi:hypothetical protein
MLPFTREQFISVFVEYNLSVWPLQFVAYLIGLAMVAMLLRPTSVSDRIIAGGLAAMWFWTGVSYHGVYFSPINEAAILFGALFALQGALFVYVGIVRGALRFGLPNTATGWLGGSLVVYSAAVYPLIGIWVGHGYPEMPMFGVTPCPVTIFTFGFLLLTTAPVSRWLLAIPFAWTLVGGSAAFLLGIPQDWLLLFTGLIAVPLLVLRDHSRPGSAARI